MEIKLDYIYKGILLLTVLLLAGCSATRLKSSADRDVYKILDKKVKEVTPDEMNLDITPPQQREIPSEDTSLTLEDVLVIASKNNRDYQTAKEDVYLKALALTSQRYQFGLRYGVGGTITWSKDEDQENISGDLNLNLVKWLAQGAQITFDIVQNYLKYLMGNKTEAFQTVLSLDILQPLFRGAGRRVAQADLIQAERDVVYQIRTFLRYQRSFSVTVAEKYFNILQSKSSLENYWKNYVYLKQTSDRVQMLAEAGRIPSFEADQAKQDEFRAYQRWIEAGNSYEELLDEFKIFLGFSPEVEISLEEKGLESFLNKGIPEIKINQEDSIKLALEKRLDLMTSYDQLEDSKRDTVVALNALRTKLDLSIGVDSSSPEDDHPNLEFASPSYTSGLDFELPLNKIPERNAYREALINLERQKRSVVLEEDEVKLDVLSLYRSLEEAYQTYLIQKGSLELANKRVDSTNLLLQAGRATTRDLLEAQESYLGAKNALSSAIVNYLVSYLKFLRDTELLELDNKGVWKGDLYEKISGETQQVEQRSETSAQ
jgi:outer membrane protein TolC